jgi:hypothetical protein
MAGFESVFPKGMKRKGTLDPSKPIAMVKNEDGSTSTVRTIGIGTKDGEVVIPTVHPDGYIMSDEEAIERYKKTGESFGTFDTPEDASAYSVMIHNDHAQKIKKKKD